MHIYIGGSGSRGNIAFIGDRKKGRDSAGFLIDAGMTRIQTRLRSAGIDLQNVVQGVLYTHHHSDHFRPPTFSVFAKYGIPQHIPDYMRSALGVAAEQYYSEPLEFIEDVLRGFFGDSFCLQTFPCVHDVPCVGYSVTLPDDSLLTWASDTVSITPEMRALLADTSVLCIDCNYDTQLMDGSLSGAEFPESDFPSAWRAMAMDPYPPAVCDRIVTRGHLDTRRVIDLISSAPWLDRVILLHLSPRYQDVSLLLERIRRSGIDPRCEISVADQWTPMDISLDIL